ncbi:MAG: 3D-(3,5/4)-trihydroxycyclohexane-1,2-dione acylhydrolase (decyclizing) [Deltaproteobacteria bacterium]|nr:3D-(3,5/4)-trihydroxycyclohexane-1,2-dione acylhydrolase (decyclizing) [Deltaproteobacteria bacterium]
MTTQRLTMAQALVKYLIAQRVEIDGVEQPLFGGVWAIFGHGCVAGLGEALEPVREQLPTLRAHNEQAMAHAAIAFAKACARRRVMACTTSIGPGATNLVTAAATAHVNRLPLLLLPGDVFASRFPDPVLQQLEDFGDGSMTANDCLRPVSRYWDRILRPEQLLAALPRALQVLTDPAECGPVTLALPQDVQTMAFDYPESFFAPRLHRLRRIRPDAWELAAAAELLGRAQKPLLIAGGGVHYALACDHLRHFVDRCGVPVAETQAGKGALPWNHPLNVGAIGVTGASAANALAAEADVVLAVGTRLSDFTTASRTLFQDPEVRFIGLNVALFDAGKHGCQPLLADARAGLELLPQALSSWRAPSAWSERARQLAVEWNLAVERVTAPRPGTLPTDAQVLGMVNRCARPGDVVVCAAGGLPGELHKLWRTERPGDYHVEYGYSCMGYEIAGGLGVRLARPAGEVFVMVGDGSYLMLNSEIASSVMHGRKITVILLDNHGFGCIHRLQTDCGSGPFNNLLADGSGKPPAIDFAAHAAALGARSERLREVVELGPALERARQADRTTVLVIETDPSAGTGAGGAWWEVAVAEVSGRASVQEARRRYDDNRRRQRVGE